MLILYPHTSLILTGDAIAVMCDKRAPVTSDLVGCPPTWKAELRVPSAGAAAPPPGVVAAGGRMNVAEGRVTARGGRVVRCGAQTVCCGVARLKPVVLLTPVTPVYSMFTIV